MANSSLPPPNSRDDFEIAIICALAIEYDAVTLLIDQFWDEDGDKYGRAINDPNTYTTGRMRGFDIVLVLLPEKGKVSAASAASSFRSSFHRITLALLVGTCGGVPYTKDNEEILLGDVIISKTVIQYDLGRQYNGQFLTEETLEERLGKPGTNVRSILTVMETNHGRERLETRAAVLLEQLQRHASQKKMRKPVKYEYLGVLNDRLFQSSYLHRHQVLLPYRCCEEVPCHSSHTLSCAELGCEDEHLVQRQRLKEQAQEFRIFIGRFGSGDTVLRSGTYRDRIAQRHGLLAFEMEGAGIWDGLPCIIVKGVSNYADGHWDADSNWQHFAAATAAATARALIERYPKTDRPYPPLVVIKDGKRRTKEEDECLRDMHITDPSLDKKRIEDTNGGLLRDSYIWILTNAEFIQWRENADGGLLWIKGDPGKGKTMLLCGLINELQAKGATRPYYFFCQASDSRLNSATKVLCSLVYSIACDDELALEYVMEKYKHAGRELFNNTNSWTALSQILTRILRNISLKDKVFIVDGLDECVSDLPLLLDFISRAPGLSEAKWIVSSRNWPSIEEKLNTSSKKLPLSLELNEQSISEAVRVYIKHKVNQLATLKKLDEKSRDAVESHLSANANGTFLWVALVYKELFKGGVKKRHLRDLMTAFPPDLGPLYMRMMTHVCESQDADICVQVLELFSLIYRPISLVELASFVEILEDNNDFDELRDVIATCGSFLVLKDDVVYFVHQSAKDFLLSNASNQIFENGLARKHHDIFSRSIRILSQTLRRDMYKLRHPGALTRDASAHDPDPLATLRYACLFWVDHLRDTGMNSSGKIVSQASLQDEGVVHSFLRVYLLRWLEAFCLMGKLSEGIIAIKTLESLTAQDLGLLPTFIRDARRFVLSFRSAIEYTPLQLYSSALIFTPTSSIVRQTFEPIHTTPWIMQKPSVQFEWDACLQTLEGHQEFIPSLVFSPDNTKLASCSRDGNFRVWDRATSACLQSLTFDIKDEHASMAFSPDSSQLALAWNKFIKILDLNTSACIMTLNNGPHYKSMAFSPNGMQLILSDERWEDGNFQIWDLTTGMQLRKEDYYQDVGEPAIFQFDAPGEGDITVIRSPITGSRVQVVNKYGLERVVFTSDGMQFALLTAQGWIRQDSGPGETMDDSRPPSIYILDAATGKCVQKFVNDVWDTAPWALSPDGTRLATAGVSEDIQIWDVTTGASLFILSTYEDITSSVAFSPDGMELASSLWDKTIKIWNLALAASVDSEERRKKITGVTFSPDSTRLAFIIGAWFLASFTIVIWDPVKGICQQQLQVCRASLGSWSPSNKMQLAFSPDNTLLAYSRKGEIAIRDLTTNPQQDRFEFTASGSIRSIIFSSCGTRLALSVHPPVGQIVGVKIMIWDVTNGTVVHTISSEIEIVEIQFSADSRRLGSVSRNGIAAIWDLNTGECLQTLDFDYKKTFSSAEVEYLDVDYLRRAQSPCFITNMMQNPASIHSAIHEFDLSLTSSWLLRRGEPFLWLPPEYRPQGMTFAGGNIAIVNSTNMFLSFCFNLAELDAEMASNRSSILKV
ncbi:WD40 repeat-like protein [Trichoderma asperelloides]|nr:WD40 repeat-like protein [Trichoderma asperelloides]